MAQDLQNPPSSPTIDDRLDVIRSLVVDAGLEVLDRDGLGLRADSISYAKVFAYLQETYDIRVTRSSVHGRIWRDQDHFRADVLSAAAQHTSGSRHSSMLHDATVDILDHLDGQDLTARERSWAFCRAMGQFMLSYYLESEQYRRFQSVKAAARNGEDRQATSVLQSLVRNMVDGNQDDRVRRFSFVFSSLGLRPRAALGLDLAAAADLFLTLAQILVAGTHLDYHAGFTTMASKVETNSDPGDDAPWTPFGLGYLAIMEFLFEEDPDAGPPPADGYPSAAETVPLHSLPEGPTDVASLITHRPRRSLEELRQLVLATGVHLFLRDGLRLKADSLTYAAVFAHIRQTRGIVIHRSTVHQKIWCNQDEFRAEVLAAATRYGTDEPATATRQAMAAQTVTRNPDGSVNVRQLILDNSLATVVAQLQVSATSPTFRRWQSIKAALLSEPTEQQAEALRRAVDRSYDELHAALEEIYRSVVPLVGLRVNPALGISEDHAYYLFLVICVTFSVGADYNTSAGSGLAERTFPVPRVDGTGRSDDWPVPAIASLAVLDLLFVPQDQTQ